MRVKAQNRHAMAGRYINRAQQIKPLHFKFFCTVLIYHARGFSGLIFMLFYII
jgi:hypothetical protein